MADIYGKDPRFSSIDFATADEMILQVGLQKPADEYLIQNVAIQYNQPLNRVYEVGSSKVFLISGRPVGTVQIGKIIGEKTIESLFGKSGTGIWSTSGQAYEKVLVFKKRTKIASPDKIYSQLAYIVTGATIDGYSMATDANGLLIQENVSIQFAGLIFGFNEEISIPA